MSLKVVGAGVGRTGTHSLKVALEQLLGGRCHHMVEVLSDPTQVPAWMDAIEGRPVDWSNFPPGYVALVDWPGHRSGESWRLQTPTHSCCCPSVTLNRGTTARRTRSFWRWTTRRPRHAPGWRRYTDFYVSASATSFNDPGVTDGRLRRVIMRRFVLRFRRDACSNGLRGWVGAYLRAAGRRCARRALPDDQFNQWRTNFGLPPFPEARLAQQRRARTTGASEPAEVPETGDDEVGRGFGRELRGVDAHLGRSGGS